jgi:hypothetical protein
MSDFPGLYPAATPEIRSAPPMSTITGIPWPIVLPISSEKSAIADPGQRPPKAHRAALSSHLNELIRPGVTEA